MCPIEISVVQDDHHENAEEKICEAVVFNLIIGLRVFDEWRKENDETYDGKNESCNNRVSDLANVIAVKWKFVLYPSKSPRLFLQNIKNEKCDGGEDQVPQKDNQQKRPETFTTGEICG